MAAACDAPWFWSALLLLNGWVPLGCKCREVAWLMLKYVASPSRESFGGRFDVVLSPSFGNKEEQWCRWTACLSFNTNRSAQIGIALHALLYNGAEVSNNKTNK
jgi:hypothetical protein